MCTLYTTVNFPTECWCHFPEYPSMQYTYRVSVISNTTITTNKYRGFSAVESSRTIGSWCLWMNLTVKARHRQQLLLPLQSKCALYTPKWLMMPFPRISMHAVYTKSDKDVITTRHRQQLLLPLHSKCAHCTPQWIFQQSADANSQNIQPCSILTESL